mmetsp:Transcript_14958/g.26894  ORF Transcript_14958/g.26894 Transcript_14958/m.26894 type:complete len:227 (-) Transcript_14958:363-1043(-)
MFWSSSIFFLSFLLFCVVNCFDVRSPMASGSSSSSSLSDAFRLSLEPRRRTGDMSSSLSCLRRRLTGDISFFARRGDISSSESIRRPRRFRTGDMSLLSLEGPFLPRLGSKSLSESPPRRRALTGDTSSSSSEALVPFLRTGDISSSEALASFLRTGDMSSSESNLARPFPPPSALLTGDISSSESSLFFGPSFASSSLSSASESNLLRRTGDSSSESSLAEGCSS